MFQENAQTRAVEYFRAVSSGHAAITKLTPEDHESAYAQADAFIHFTGAHINFGNYQPSYHRVYDAIYMPHRSLFVSDHLFYRIQFHELVHWSGGPNRLNRERRGNPQEAYQYEEFVAQQGATLLADHFHMDTDDFDHSYFIGYSANSEEAESMLQTAHQEADRAVDYLLHLVDRNQRRHEQ